MVNNSLKPRDFFFFSQKLKPVTDENTEAHYYSHTKIIKMT